MRPRPLKAMKLSTGRRYEGYLFAPPQPGAQLFIVQANGHTVMTTTIQRVMEANGSFYVQTRNSVYRVEWVSADTPGEGDEMTAAATASGIFDDRFQ